MSTILITGTSGFIGSSIVKAIEIIGDEVSNSHSFDIISLNRPFTIDSINSITAHQPEYIIHCAGEIYNSANMFDSNIVLTHQLLESVLKVNNIKSFIYIGSSSEYGFKKQPMVETDTLVPRNMYEATKGAATLLCQGYAKEYNLPIQVVRPFSVYGDGDKPHKLIPQIYKSWKESSEISIYSGVHDYIYIKDFVSAVLKIMLNDNIKPGEIFNVGSGIQTSNLQVIETFLSAGGGNLKVRYYNSKSKEFDSEFWCSNNSKARNILNWSPKYDLYSGLKEYIKIQNERGIN